MKCPLQKIVLGKDNEGNEITVFGDCIEKDCAWWFGRHECCSLPAIANCLEELRFKEATNER